MIQKFMAALTLCAVFTGFTFSAEAHDNKGEGKIVVSGTSTVSITPDRITVEVGMEEYYRKVSANDSVKVKIGDIENEVLKAFAGVSVPDSLITVTDVGNYRYNRADGEGFLMAKRVAATLHSMWQLDSLASSMGMRGVTSFRISKTDASDMDKYNRRGLQAALDKAREKAQLIAVNEGLVLGCPIEIVEDGPLYYDEEAVVTNVALDGGALYSRSMTMDNMKKIVRRYNVRVTYATSPR